VFHAPHDRIGQVIDADESVRGAVAAPKGSGNPARTRSTRRRKLPRASRPRNQTPLSVELRARVRACWRGFVFFRERPEGLAAPCTNAELINTRRRMRMPGTHRLRGKPRRCFGVDPREGIYFHRCIGEVGKSDQTHDSLDAIKSCVLANFAGPTSPRAIHSLLHRCCRHIARPAQDEVARASGLERRGDPEIPPTLNGGPMLPRRARRMDANLITRRACWEQA
jgi:hypothetical protein